MYVSVFCLRMCCVARVGVCVVVVVLLSLMLCVVLCAHDVVVLCLCVSACGWGCV